MRLFFVSGVARNAETCRHEARRTAAGRLFGPGGLAARPQPPASCPGLCAGAHARPMNTGPVSTSAAVVRSALIATAEVVTAGHQ